jgi:hypothetical protein
LLFAQGGSSHAQQATQPFETLTCFMVTDVYIIARWIREMFPGREHLFNRNLPDIT